MRVNGAEDVRVEVVSPALSIPCRVGGEEAGGGGRGGEGGENELGTVRMQVDHGRQQISGKN